MAGTAVVVSTCEVESIVATVRAVSSAETAVVFAPTSKVLIRAIAEPREIARRAFTVTLGAIGLLVETPVWSVVMGFTLPRMSHVHQPFRAGGVPDFPRTRRICTRKRTAL